MRILIIHTAFIGDIVLSTPILKKLKEKYPESEITYLTTPAGAAILRNNPNISEIISYDKRGTHSGIMGVWNLGKRLRQMNFNLVISLHRYLRSSVLAWLTRSPERIGYETATGAWLFTKKVVYDEKKHEVERILSFVEGEKRDREYEIELYPREEEKIKIDTVLKGYEDKKIIAVAPGSKWFTKKWPLEYFNSLLEKLENREDIGVVVIGGKEEELLNVKKTKNMVDLRGKTTLLQLAELLKRSEIVVTNDSSPVHIASAFKNTHIIGIFGPTVEKFGFFPWSRNSQVLEVHGLECRPCAIHGGDRCPKKHFRCMLEITPEMVYEKIEEKLAVERDAVEK
ncbi:MAG: lipopolysaccharide heptosyltransferase II [Fusobacteriaceae bacterium]